MKFKLTGEIVKIFEVEAVADSQGGYDALRFRVEIISDPAKPEKMTARIWRKEFYRIQPTFPQEKGEPKLDSSDELILFEETSIIDTDGITSPDWKEVLNLVLKRLEERLM